jgi:hypothetical protein
MDKSMILNFIMKTLKGGKNHTQNIRTQKYDTDERRL